MKEAIFASSSTKQDPHDEFLFEINIECRKLQPLSIRLLNFLQNRIDNWLVAFSKAMPALNGDSLHKTRIELSAKRIIVLCSIKTKYFSATQFFYFGTNHLGRRSLAGGNPIRQMELKIRCRAKAQESNNLDLLQAFCRDAIQHERQNISPKRISDNHNSSSLPESAVMLQNSIQVRRCLFGGFLLSRSSGGSSGPQRVFLWLPGSGQCRGPLLPNLRRR